MNELKTCHSLLSLQCLFALLLNLQLQTRKATFFAFSLINLRRFRHNALEARDALRMFAIRDGSATALNGLFVREMLHDEKHALLTQALALVAHRHRGSRLFLSLLAVCVCIIKNAIQKWSQATQHELDVFFVACGPAAAHSSWQIVAKITIAIIGAV